MDGNRSFNRPPPSIGWSRHMISNTMSSGLSTEFEIIAVLPALEVLLVFFFFLIKPYRLVPKYIIFNLILPCRFLRFFFLRAKQNFWQGKLSLAVKSHFRQLADIYFSPVVVLTRPRKITAWLALINCKTSGTSSREEEEESDSNIEIEKKKVKPLTVF